MHTHRSRTVLLAGAISALTLAMVVRLSGASSGAAPAASPAPPASQAAPAQKPAPPADKPGPASGFVGDDETCITCHENQSLKGTPHGRERDVRTPAAKQGCETCHGPGQAHVDAV